MGLRLFRQISLYTLAVMVFIGTTSHIDVWAAEKYPLIYETVKDEEEAYMVLTGDGAIACLVQDKTKEVLNITIWTVKGMR